MWLPWPGCWASRRGARDPAGLAEPRPPNSSCASEEKQTQSRKETVVAPETLTTTKVPLRRAMQMCAKRAFLLRRVMPLKRQKARQEKTWKNLAKFTDFRRQAVSWVRGQCPVCSTTLISLAFLLPPDLQAKTHPVEVHFNWVWWVSGGRRGTMKNFFQWLASLKWDNTIPAWARGKFSYKNGCTVDYLSRLPVVYSACLTKHFDLHLVAFLT